MNLSHRTDTFTDSVIRRMTRVCLKYNAINLSQRFPDFDPPKEICDRLADMYHLDAKSVSAYVCGEHGDSEMVTCGSTKAMMCAMMTVCDPGDKVVVFSPFYENYGADAILSDAKPVYVPLHPPLFNFDKKELEDAFKQHPKALILCNPSNPCGKVFTREELEYIASLAVKYDTYVITDEVYEHIVYAPYEHVYFASLPGMFERTISCSSLSKTYSITGWRLGYIIAPEHIIDVAKKVHDFLTVGASAPLQEAAIVGLEFGEDYYKELQALYTHKKDLFCNGLRELGIKYTEPQGAYYVLVDISEFGYDDDVKFC